MGRAASVFIVEEGANGGDGGGDEHAARDFQRLFGVLPTLGTGRGGDEEKLPAPRRLRNTAATARWPGGREVGDSRTTATASAMLETMGTVDIQGRTAAAAAGEGRRRRLQTDCSSSCRFSEIDPCVNDPECVNGGIGCNAQGDLLCRFCSTGDEEAGSVYAACRDPDEPTPAPVPTPAPTADPDREECNAPCRDNPQAQDPCFDDPSCGGDTNLLGCNAEGYFYCRYCGFDGALSDCPFSTATPAPTPAPSAGTTVAGTPAPSVAGTPAPSVVGTAASSTSMPAAAATPAPSVVGRDTNVTTLAPLMTSTAAPTFAPVAVLSTAAPSPAPTTFAPTTSAPTAAPTPALTAAPTPAPSGAPTGAPTGAPMVSATISPSSAPTGAVTGAPTAVVATVAPTVAVGALGPAFVKGSISASGVPDELVLEKGEERLVQEVMGVMCDVCVAWSMSVAVAGHVTKTVCRFF